MERSTTASKADRAPARALLALGLTVVLLGAIGAVGPVELTFALLLAIGVFVLQMKRTPA